MMNDKNFKFLMCKGDSMIETNSEHKENRLIMKNFDKKNFEDKSTYVF